MKRNKAMINYSSNSMPRSAPIRRLKKMMMKSSEANRVAKTLIFE